MEMREITKDLKKHSKSTLFESFNVPYTKNAAILLMVVLIFMLDNGVYGLLQINPAKCATSLCPKTVSHRSMSRHRKPLTISMMTSLNDKTNSDDWELEGEVGELEEMLEHALEKENYEAAAKIRDRLSVVNMDGMSSILKLNKDFYESFLKKDAHRMSKIWLKSDDVMCIHPNQEVIGYNNVVNAWRKAFIADKAKRNSIKLSDVVLQVHGTTGWVSCKEEVTGDVEKKKNTQVGSTLHSTNLYQKSGGQWYLVHRHCTKDMDGKLNLQELLSGGGASPTIINLRGNQAGQLGAGGSSLGGLIEKIQGALNKKMNSEANEEDEDDEDEEEEITVNLSSSPNGGMVMGSALVHVEVDVDDDDDDDHDDGIFTIEDLGRGDDEIIELDELREKKLRDMMNKEKKNSKGSKAQLQYEEEDEDRFLQGQTINAIRRLHAENRITLEQKRKLLTDIIQHASSDEASNTEMAYELLMSDNEDWSNEGFVDEFADQCRAIADRMAQ